jgi:hypothetical protein
MATARSLIHRSNGRCGFRHSAADRTSSKIGPLGRLGPVAAHVNSRPLGQGRATELLPSAAEHADPRQVTPEARRDGRDGVAKRRSENARPGCTPGGWREGWLRVALTTCCLQGWRLDQKRQLLRSEPWRSTQLPACGLCDGRHSRTVPRPFPKTEPANVHTKAVAQAGRIVRSTGKDHRCAAHTAGE